MPPVLDDLAGALVAAMVEDPGDRYPRLLMADWVDYRGDRRAARLLRRRGVLRITSSKVMWVVGGRFCHLGSPAAYLSIPCELCGSTLAGRPLSALRHVEGCWACTRCLRGLGYRGL